MTGDTAKIRAKIRIGVLGASGYTGADLIRLLAGHPRAEIVLMTANAHAGKPLSAVFPHLGGLELPDLAGDPEGVVARWARHTYPEVESAFAQTRSSIEREMGEVEERLAALDPTLRAATAAARGRALHQVEGLHEKAMRALKKRDQGRATRLRRTRDALFPGGAFQERGLGLLGLVARRGRGILAELQERVDPFARGHQVVRL